MNKSRFSVQPKLPRAGLGNMLLVWARAVLYAKINDLPIMAPSWWQFRVGPYLRGERDKRNYSSLFHTKNYINKWNWLFLNLLKQEKHDNPAPLLIDLESLKQNSSHVFVFDLLPHWSNYFEYLNEYQPLIKQKLLADIQPLILKEIEDRPAPEIGIHLRMGDFRAVQTGEDLPLGGNVRTPLEWFVRIINCVRSLGYDVPITVFSDAHDNELKEILSLPGVFRSPKDNALSDMITLSKSRILVTSSGSTFSAWASYLGQCPTIYYPSQFQSTVFPESIRGKVFEGEFDPQFMEIPDLLLNNIKAAFYN
jgi:hypothetical protein